LDIYGGTNVTGTNWEEIDKLAKEWISFAGTKLKDSFEDKLKIEIKTNPNDLVTNMDKWTEQFFYSKIRETFPNHRILGEEGSGHDITDMKGIVWIIDPIDGTLNFIHQQRNFAISIGIFEDGIGKIGLIYDVVHNELYHGIKGKGVYLNEVELSPLVPVSIEESIIAVNASWVASNRHLEPHKLQSLVKRVRGTRSYGSAAIELASVAAGRVDAYITMRLAPWDFAAGVILIEELGGITSDLFGNKLDFLGKGSVFVSKPGLHEKILHEHILDSE
jgi:myo-inositol-1(or 4)-monophosphatase